MTWRVLLILMLVLLPSLSWAVTPTLPVIGDISCATSTSTVTWTANSSADLTTALVNANFGDTIKLTAGNTFTGTFTLPNTAVIPGNEGQCITIRTSAADSTLPTSTQRMAGSFLTGLPKIVTPGANASAIVTAAGAHHFQFIGVEILQCATCTDLFNIVKIGTGSETVLSDLPHHIVFDRVYIHGDPSLNVQECLALNAASVSVLNSTIKDCHYVGVDSQAIISWNGAGPFRIRNNYLEESVENIMFGGADPSIPNLVPSDIEVTYNWFNKPLTWKTDDPSYAGIHWSVKNLFELKNAQRVLVEANLFTNSWSDAQNYAIKFTSSNSSNTAPWSTCANVTFRHNVIRHAAGGMFLQAYNGIYSSVYANTILISDNLFTDIASPQWIATDAILFGQFGIDSMTITHNTADQNGTTVSADAAGVKGTSESWVYQNNLAPHNTYGVFGSGYGTGNAAMAHYFPSAVFSYNVLTGGNSANYSNYANNFFPAATANVGFLDYANGEYQLKVTSTFANAASDGTDIGADISGLLAVEAVALSGNLPGTYLATSNRPAMTANPATTNTPRATRRPSL